MLFNYNAASFGLLWCASYVLAQEKVLQLVQVIFRHGERHTEKTYPTDPNINMTFYPDGKGGLTNNGKMQLYVLGSFLREEYGKFLGDVYTEDELSVRSTEFARTRMSAQILLAGLWPPNKLQMWNANLQWIPIPVDYKPYAEEDLLNPVECVKRKQILIKQLSHEKVRELFMDPFKNLMNDLTEKTQMPIRSPQDLLDLYFIFKTETDQNCTMPDWVQNVYPEPIQSAAATVYGYLNYNKDIKIINSGYLIKEILSDINEKTVGNSKKKMALYSAHDSTMGSFLNIFNVSPVIPPYASAIIIELYKNVITDTYCIQMKFRESSIKTLVIALPECDNICTVKQVTKFVQDILPNKTYSEACSP